MALITISLITHNGIRFLPRCLDSVERQTLQDFEIVVVDNASADDGVGYIEREWTSKFGSRLTVVRNRENEGFAAANNRAIEGAKGTYILCLNQDALLAPDCIETLAHELQTRPELGSVAPSLYRWDVAQAEGLTNIIDSFGLRRRFFHVTDIGSGQVDRGQYTDALIFGVSAAVCLYRRAALDDIRFEGDYFDSSFHSYKEDVDVAYRLRARGWKSARVPRAKAWHARSAPTRSVFANLGGRSSSPYARYHSYKNQILIELKHLQGRSWIDAPLVVAYEIAKFLYLVVYEPATVRAWREITTLYPRAIRWRRHIGTTKKR